MQEQTLQGSWRTPVLDTTSLSSMIANIRKVDERSAVLSFITIEPYIDMIYVEVEDPVEEIFNISRFTFHDNLRWREDEEKDFEKKCLNSDYPLHYNSADFDRIYSYYSALHPEWHLKRYYTREMRLLDHIHHCMTRNTAKELLYKAGVDELAVRVNDAHGINPSATNPSEIYGNVPMRVIRALNTEYGAVLLSETEYRGFLKEIGSQYPDIFKDPLNDAQCEYILRLKKGDLTNPEIYRLFLSQKTRLSGLWSHSLFVRFVAAETAKDTIREKAQALIAVDPFYEKYVPSMGTSKLAELLHYLVNNKEELDRDIRRSNRKRDYSWQEHYDGYVIRYPQTINDFCRESVYMSNCLMSYLEAYVENDTTIMFLRRENDVNIPFITIEIYNRTLTQAFHRFNTECTLEETAWIKGFCWRHNIIYGCDR